MSAKRPCHHPVVFAGEEEVFPLHITPGYVPKWQTWEGVREFVQNWHDGVLSTFEQAGGAADRPVHFDKILSDEENSESPEVDGMVEYRACCNYCDVGKSYKSKSPVRDTCTLGRLFYDKKNKTITMVNSNTCLGRRVFLLGQSEKAQRKEVIGQFGEGLKLGALALVRSGRRVVICTGEERWRFGIKENEGLKERVLTVFIKRRASATPHNPANLQKDCFDDIVPPCPQQMSPEETSTQLWPVSDSEWTQFAGRFLFLERPAEMVNTTLGTLILDSGMVGQVYVKQVWTCEMKEQMSAGADFKEIQLDRDRQACIDITQLEQSLSCLWVQAVTENKSLADRYCKLLYEGKSREVAATRAYLPQMDVDTCKAIADAFFRWKGEGYPVLPTTSQDQLRRLRMELGGKTQTHMVNDTLYAVIKRAGRIPQIEPRPPPKEEPYQRPPTPTRETLTPSDEQKAILDRSYALVKRFQPDFPLEQIVCYQEEYGDVWEQGGNIEVPSWILNPATLHMRLTDFPCPAEGNDTHCRCSSSYLAAHLLSLHNRRRDSNDDLLFHVVSTLSMEVHQVSLKEGPEQMEETAGERHYHEDIIDRRVDELQRHMEALEEDLGRKQAEYKRNKADMQQQLDRVRGRVLTSDEAIHARIETIQQQKQSEMDDNDMKFQHQRQTDRKKAAEYLKKNEQIAADLASADSEYKRFEETNLDFQRGKEDELTQQMGRITQLTRKIANIVAVQRDFAIQGERLSLGIDTQGSELYKNLQEFQLECMHLREHNKCQVCKEDRQYALLKPCEHLFLCLECSKKLEKCRICDTVIKDRIPVYCP